MNDLSRRSGAWRRLSLGASALLVLLFLACVAPAWASDTATADATITCTVAPADVLYGQSVTVSGAITPATEGTQITIAQDGVDLTTVATDAAGAYSASIVAQRGGARTARLAPDSAPSAPAQLTVRPVAKLTRDTVYPFLPARLVLRVSPTTYDAKVTAYVWHRSRLLGTVSARCKAGTAVLSLPTPGIGAFTVVVKLPAAAGLAACNAHLSYTVPWLRLAIGSRGPFVRGLLLRLAALGIHVPGVGSTFSRADADAMVAFQKAFHLPRTYAADYDDWRRLDTGPAVKPRHAIKGTHLEVDKTRQVLMVVRNGKVLGLIAISTGKSGNTPLGVFRILHKALWATPLYGPGLLFRSMRFVGNFAIHGYPSVPPYPASHGCVREPLWAADWVYRLSYVGERLYIYR
jgi:N-acetylmuramoyl-L-alanine amidase